MITQVVLQYIRCTQGVNVTFGVGFTAFSQLGFGLARGNRLVLPMEGHANQRLEFSGKRFDSHRLRGVLALQTAWQADNNGMGVLRDNQIL